MGTRLRRQPRIGMGTGTLRQPRIGTGTRLRRQPRISVGTDALRQARVGTGITRPQPGVGRRAWLWAGVRAGSRVGAGTLAGGRARIGPPAMAGPSAGITGGRAPPGPGGFLRASVSHASPLRPSSAKPLVAQQCKITTSCGIGRRRRYLVGHGGLICPGGNAAALIDANGYPTPTYCILA